MGYTTDTITNIIHCETEQDLKKKTLLLLYTLDYSFQLDPPPRKVV